LAAIVLVFGLVVVEVNVRRVEVVRRGSLGVVDLVMRGEINGFCRRGRILLSSVGSSGADIVVEKC